MKYWDAYANIPYLANGIGVTGDMYEVSVPGNTYLDGRASWQIGDRLTFANSKWQAVSVVLSPLPTQGFGSFTIGTVLTGPSRTHITNIQPTLDMFATKTEAAEGSVFMIKNGEPDWVPMELAVADLIKNPTIRDRVENVIIALKNLEMTAKLIKN